MARTRTTFFDRVQTLLSQAKQAILLFLVALMVVLTSSTAYSQDLLQQGRSLYDSGRYLEAATVLQQVAQKPDDPLQQALALSNLSLVYQALNQWGQAQQAIDTSLNLLQSSPTASTQQKAQALEVRGQLALSTGKAQSALEDWRSAAQLFEQNGDRVSASRTRLHQTLALQQLGLYREAFSTLRSSSLVINDNDSTLKVTCLRSLSRTLRVVGTNLLTESSQEKQPLSALAKICTGSDLPELKDQEKPDYLEVAEKLLEKAQTLVFDRSLEQAEIWLDLGNLSRDAYSRTKDAYERVKTPTNQSNLPVHLEKALQRYQAVEKMGQYPLLQAQAKLNYLSLFLEVDRWLPLYNPKGLKQVLADQHLEPISFANQLAKEIDRLPTNYATLQNHLTLAQILLPPVTQSELPPINPEMIAQQLTIAKQQAIQLGDRVTQSYAVGYLGRLQENQQHWQQAYEETNRSLKLTEDLQQPKLAYEWQWQQGRILREMGNRQAAIAAYETAIKSLDTVRQDLLGLGNPDLQFSFRDRVEPVYRELVELLLTENGAKPRNRDLQTARKTIADLQVAQLENYLRCTLQIKDPVELDAVADQHNAAIIYPILLPDRLATIVKLPKSKILQYYSSDFQSSESLKELNPRCLKLTQSYLTCDTRSQAIDKLRDFRKQLEDSKGTHKRLAEEIYDWLIRPVETDSSSPINSTKVETLVFVLDNDLQQIPMAALYDRQTGKYLAQKYAIALNLGSQLEKSQSLKKPLVGLTGGLTNSEPKLKYAGVELDSIRKEIMVWEIRDEQFTRRNFQSKLNSSAFKFVHLVTHGEFTSNPETTGINAIDGLINLNQIRDIFQIQSQNRPEPIELLVLSACRTATGDSRAPLGMAGVAVRSGARSTLASLWYTGDEYTSSLMREFYQNLKAVDAPNKAEALQRAQKTLIDSNIAPVNWAQFVLLGNWL